MYGELARIETLEKVTKAAREFIAAWDRFYKVEPGFPGEQYLGDFVCERLEILKEAVMVMRKVAGQMCSGVIIHRSGQEDVRCETQGELALAIGVENIVFIDYSDFGPRTFEPMVCLCPVDLGSTADRAGHVLSDKDPRGKYDPFDAHFYPAEGRNEEP